MSEFISTAETAAIQYLPVDQLIPHPDNPRKDLGDLTELADSIRENGIYQNLTVTPGHTRSLEEWIQICKAEGVSKTDAKGTYEPELVPEGYTVIIGHRRLAAAKLAGLEVVPCIIREMDVKEQLSTMLLENMQRSDLTVYEQAQGFQLMLDLGETVESISKQSGFSQSTVRRRVKMAELDQTKLKEVSSRQIALSDFDKLAGVRSLATRNKLLEDIGTSNFTYRVENAIREQEIRDVLPAVQKVLKEAHAKELKYSERYSGNYTEITVRGKDIRKWDKETPLLPKSCPKELFYFLDKDYGSLWLYKKSDRGDKKKKTPEEKAREAAIKEAWEKVHELQELTYKLRSDFVKEMPFTTKNAFWMMFYAMAANILCTINYSSGDRPLMMETLGVENSGYDKRSEEAMASFYELDKAKYPTILYAGFGDAASSSYFSGYQKEFPKHCKNARLDAVYDWLTAMGYEMSDDEKALQNGTHEIFHRGDSEAAK